MLVSHKKEFIYTKTVKTAGTSIEVYFEPYCLPEGEWELSNKRDVYEGGTGIIGYHEGGDIAGKKWYHHMSRKNCLNLNIYYYDRKTIDLVEEKYKDDIIRFGYSAPSCI